MTESPVDHAVSRALLSSVICPLSSVFRLVLQLRIMSARAVVCAAGGLLVAALPARARDDDLWIGRPLMEHEVGQQVLDFGHA